MADSRSFTPENVNKLKAKFEGAGQGHVFTFYDELSQGEKEAFFAQLLKIDPDRVNTLRDLALNPPKDENAGAAAVLEPLPESATASILDSKPEDIQRWYNKGLDLIAANKVAVVLLAGGQGTRLGSKAPKGCYNIGLPSGKSLFELQAERIAKVQELAAQKAGKDASAVLVPWYVMTSGPTRGPTEKYFAGKEPLAELSEQDNKRRLAGKPHFGLAAGQVTIFEQGVLPCIANDGKIMLESKGKVAVAPDGNGGLYKALQDEGVLASMAERGVEHVYAYCVDNCLSKVADPVFIGFSAERGASIATKVVRKRDATESVGLIVQKNGKPDVVEYSEIDAATAEAQDPRQPGVLKFRAANIVNHYYSFAYLDGMGDAVNRLPPHVARKKIPHLDLATGAQVTDVAKPNGIKLEQFVFDNFKWVSLDRFACFEVKRQEEFSPLKNADPKKDAAGAFESEPVDGPHTSRSDILSQGKRWLEAAGATVSVEGVEVSPLKSYSGEGLEEYKGKTIDQETL
ncbi:UDP-N-acetylglucosamine pyrophosphorylase [Diatrype stigma]|uniref:UDP-N-acetylglucosamine diphosphorylase n=1 Tax=Diatrype stigma TaxID=117547 RepID=A0AAN9UZU7_9PEZI